jgi:hypothetical protein
MSQSTSPNATFPAGMSPSVPQGPEAGQPVDPEVLEFRSQFDGRSPLDELVRRGAQQMLQAAINAEVEQFLDQHSGRVDAQGRRQVVRNGHLPTREILTGAGPLEVQQPRVCAPSASLPAWLGSSGFISERPCTPERARPTTEPACSRNRFRQA